MQVQVLGLASLWLLNFRSYMPSPESSFYRGPDVPDFSRPEPVGRLSEVEKIKAVLQPDSEVICASVVAPGGVGKSDILRACIADEAFLRDTCKFEHVLYWSFYSQGSSERVVSCDSFFEAALDALGVEGFEQLPPAARAHLLARTLAARQILVCLDGLEPLQYGEQFLYGQVKDNGLATFLRLMAEQNESSSKVLITTRLPVADLKFFEESGKSWSMDLGQLSPEAAIELLSAKQSGLDHNVLKQVHEAVGSHSYSVLLLRNIAQQLYAGDYGRLLEDFRAFPKDTDTTQRIERGNIGAHAFNVFAFLASKPECANVVAVAELLGLFDRPVHTHKLESLRSDPLVSPAELTRLSAAEWSALLAQTRALGLLYPAHQNHPDIIDGHALVREHFGPHFEKTRPDAYKAGCLVLAESFLAAKDQPFSTQRFSDLYQAVRYYCLAGELDRAFGALDTAWNKSAPPAEHFPGTRKFGLHGLELVAISHFFGPLFEKMSLEQQALLFVEAGIRFRNLGRIPDSINAFESAKSIIDQRALSPRPEFVQGLCGLCDMYAARNDLARAINCGEDAVALSDQAAVPFQRGLARSRLAEALLINGDAARANEFLSEALSIFGTLAQTPLPESQALYTAALIACNRGEEDSFLRQAAELQTKRGEPPSLLGRAIRRLAQAEAAISLAERSLSNPGHALGYVDSAARLVKEGLPLLDQAGYPDYIAPGLLCAARVAKLRNDPASAARFTQRAHRLATLHEFTRFLR